MGVQQIVMASLLLLLQATQVHSVKTARMPAPSRPDDTATWKATSASDSSLEVSSKDKVEAEKSLQDAFVSELRAHYAQLMESSSEKKKRQCRCPDDILLDEDDEGEMDEMINEEEVFAMIGNLWASSTSVSSEGEHLPLAMLQAVEAKYGLDILDTPMFDEGNQVV